MTLHEEDESIDIGTQGHDSRVRASSSNNANGEDTARDAAGEATIAIYLCINNSSTRYLVYLLYRTSNICRVLPGHGAKTALGRTFFSCFRFRCFWAVPGTAQVMLACTTTCVC